MSNSTASAVDEQRIQFTWPLVSDGDADLDVESRGKIELSRRILACQIEISHWNSDASDSSSHISAVNEPPADQPTEFVASHPSTAEAVTDQRSNSPETSTASPLTFFVQTGLPSPDISFNMRPPPPLSPSPFPSTATSAEGGVFGKMPDFDITSRPPFVNPIDNFGYQAYSVIKISNIPFSVTIAEIKQLVKSIADHALIVDHYDGYPVHIIMERTTGKTLECYVEFKHPGAAEDVVGKVETRNSQGRAVKIGTRHVKFAVSSCGEIAAALFPRAQHCRWDPLTGLPEPHMNGNFRGFFTVEEMLGIVKLAETPQRSLISNRSYQRPYESMISTLYKFPWRATQYYTVNARNILFTAYMHLLRILVAKVPPMTDPSSIQHLKPQVEREVGLNHSLLMDFLFAGLNTPCFSLRQKCYIVQNCGSIGLGFGLELQSGGWPFQALHCPRNYPPEHLTAWLAILEAGYQDIELGNLVHGFEKFVGLTRDDSGFLVVEVTDTGKSLLFNELIAIEAALMELMVEKGRVRWCLEHDVSYTPLRFPKPFSYHNDINGIGSAMRALGLDHNDFALPLVDDGSLVVATRVTGRNNPDGRKSAWFQDMKDYTIPRRVVQSAFSDDLFFGNVWSIPHAMNCHENSRQNPHDGSSSGQRSTDAKRNTPGTKPSRSDVFNPATPPFIPSQPWFGINTNARHDNTPLVHAPFGPRGHSLGQMPHHAARAPRLDSSLSLGNPMANSPSPSVKRRSAFSVETALARLESTDLNSSLSHHGSGNFHDPHGSPAWGVSIWGPPAPPGSPDGQVVLSNIPARNIRNAGSPHGSRSSSARYNSISIQASIKEESDADMDEANEHGGTGTERALRAEFK